MYYRFTRIHFDDERYDALLDWTDTVREDVEGIDGFVFAELCQSGPGEGMIIAAYTSEDSFTRAADMVAGIMGGMAEYLTSEPHTHAGTSDRTFRRA
jgi:hypothetical protein